nr:MAG TPA: hypothetical protein [Caudoviricetes sp.]
MRVSNTKQSLPSGDADAFEIRRLSIRGLSEWGRSPHDYTLKYVIEHFERQS